MLFFFFFSAYGNVAYVIIYLSLISADSIAFYRCNYSCACLYMNTKDNSDGNINTLLRQKPFNHCLLNIS